MNWILLAKLQLLTFMELVHKNLYQYLVTTERLYDLYPIIFEVIAYLLLLGTYVLNVLVTHILKIHTLIDNFLVFAFLNFILKVYPKLLLSKESVAYLRYGR